MRGGERRLDMTEVTRGACATPAAPHGPADWLCNTLSVTGRRHGALHIAAATYNEASGPPPRLWKRWRTTTRVRSCVCGFVNVKGQVWKKKVQSLLWGIIQFFNSCIFNYIWPIVTNKLFNKSVLVTSCLFIFTCALARHELRPFLLTTNRSSEMQSPPRTTRLQLLVLSRNLLLCNPLLQFNFFFSNSRRAMWLMLVFWL